MSDMMSTLDYIEILVYIHIYIHILLGFDQSFKIRSLMTLILVKFDRSDYH